MSEVIATETLIVHDDALGIDRQLLAGQPVPLDLIEPYRNAVGDEQASKTPADDAADEITSKSVEDLQKLADERGVSVQGTGANGNVVKGDLLKALQA